MISLMSASEGIIRGIFILNGYINALNVHTPKRKEIGGNSLEIDGEALTLEVKPLEDFQRVSVWFASHAHSIAETLLFGQPHWRGTLQQRTAR